MKKKITAIIVALMLSVLSTDASRNLPEPVPIVLRTEFTPYYGLRRRPLRKPALRFYNF